MKSLLICFWTFVAFFPLSASSQDSLFLQPGPEGKDCQLWSINPDINYGNTPKFACMGWTFYGVPGVHRAAIDFDLAAIPEEYYILEARLSLYYLCLEPNYVPQSGDNESYLQLITSPWDEYTATYNNQPSTTSVDQVYLPASTEPEQNYTDIDVTLPVRKLHQEPDNYHGLLLRCIHETPYNCLLFASGDYEVAELRPMLKIIYLECQPPEVDFTFEATGLAVNFTGISPTANSWHWDFGDGDTSDLQSPEHIYLEEGLYEVVLRVEDSCYFAEYSEWIDICVEAPEAMFTFEPQDLTVFFQDSSSGSVTNYFWDFGDGYFSSLANPWHHYDSSGQYLVCLAVGNSCGSDTTCSLIDLCAAPVAGFQYDVEDMTVSFGNTTLYGENFFWDFGDGYYSNLMNPYHEYDLTGTYLVCLNAWNECGADTVCQEVALSTVSIDEIATETILAWPNPAREEVFIRSRHETQCVAGIYDLSGKVLINQAFGPGDCDPCRIDVTSLVPGMYLIRISDVENSLFQKLIITR